jgi:hypothetical protein
MTSIQRKQTTSTPSTPTTSAPTTSTPASTSMEEATDSLPTQPSTSTSTSTSTPKTLSESERKRVEGDLRRSFAPTVLDAGRGADIVKLLEKLPPQDFAAVVGQMAADGRLERLTDSLDAKGSARLMSLLESNGVVDAVPITQAKASPTAPQPPMPPHLVKVDAGAPPALRALAEEHNIAAAKAYRAAFDDYLVAYNTAVDDAKSVGALRALGPPTEPTLPASMPGAPSASAQTSFREAGVAVLDSDTMEHVANRIRELTGKPIAGSTFTLEASAFVKLADGLAVGGTAGASLSPTGIDADSAAAAELTDSTGGIALDQDGTLTIEGDAGVVDVGVDLNAEDGVTVKGGMGPLEGSARFNGDEMEFGVGLSKEVKVGKVEAEIGIEARMGLQGVTAEDAAAFVSTSDVGFFDVPPELKQGKDWTKLSSSTRAHYEALGWTAKEWGAARDLAMHRR